MILCDAKKEFGGGSRRYPRGTPARVDKTLKTLCRPHQSKKKVNYMDESVKTMIAARAKCITDLKKDVERCRELLQFAQEKVEAAEFNLDDHVTTLEDAQTSLYIIVQEAFPYKYDEDDE